ncbi:hypothetical protein pb186bvf_004173 [Paramecium bursaria]
MMIGQSGSIELLIKNKLPIGCQYIQVEVVDIQKIENENNSATLLTLNDAKQSYMAIVQQGEVQIGKLNIWEWEADDNMIHIYRFSIPNSQMFQQQFQGPQNPFIDISLLNNTFSKGINQYQTQNTTFQNQSFENLDHQQNLQYQKQQQLVNLKYEQESFQCENKKQKDNFYISKNQQFQNQFQNQKHDQHQQQQPVTIEGIIKMKTQLKLCKNGQDKYFSIRIQTGHNNLTKIQFFHPFSLEYINLLIKGKSYRFINFGEGVFNGFRYLKAINESKVTIIKDIQFQQVIQKEFLGKVINVEPQKKVQKLTILKDGQQVKIKLIDQEDYQLKTDQNYIFQNFIEGSKFGGTIKYKSSPQMRINAINIIQQDLVQNNHLNTQNNYINNKLEWSSIEYIKKSNSQGNVMVNLIAICQYEQDYQAFKTEGKQKKDYYLYDSTGSILLHYWPQQNQNNLIANGQIMGFLHLKVIKGQNDEKILTYFDRSEILQDKNILKLYDEYDEVKEQQKKMKQ